MTKLANRAKNLSFAPFEGMWERYAEMVKAHEAPHCCYLMPNGVTWAIRIYFCSSFRTIGYVDGKVVNALRFADMAQVHFYKYKQRNSLEPMDENLNYTLAQAKHDLEHEQEAAKLLIDIERYLLERGYIPNHEEIRKERESRRKRAVDQRAQRRTVSGQIGGMFKQLEETIKQGYTVLASHIQSLEDKIARSEKPAVILCGAESDNSLSAKLAEQIKHDPPLVQIPWNEKHGAAEQERLQSLFNPNANANQESKQ